MSDVKSPELPQSNPELPTSFKLPRFNRPATLEKRPFEPMAVRMPIQKRDIVDKGPMAVRVYHLPYIGDILDPDYKRALKRLGLAVGALTISGAMGFFIVRHQGVETIPPQIPQATGEQTSAVENRASLEDFLFEGFTREEKIEAAKRIVFYMSEPGSIIDVGKDVGRNIIQAIGGIPSEDLRPMDQDLLKNRVSTLLAQAHPDFSSSQLQTRTKLLMAIFDAESGLRPGVINVEEDAAGLGQVTPPSAKEVIMRFKRQADRSANPQNSIFAKYFKDIPINLKTKEITDEEWAIIKNKLKDPNINILVTDELLNLYTELHTYPAMGLLAYGSQPTALALAASEYTKLVGKVNPEEVERDFKGIDEEGNPDPTKEPATKKYTKLFTLNPIKLMHPAVTAALKSTGNFLRIHWDYPWMITAKALGGNPDDFPAVARMVEEAKASQTIAQSPS